MTSLRWVRLDTSFPLNQKVLHLAETNQHRAIAVYCCGLAYAGSQGTDGWIPKGALRIIHARPVDAQRLVDVGLWTPHPGGWDIHDWLDYQPSGEDHTARSERARAAALTRWRNPNRDAPRMRDA